MLIENFYLSHRNFIYSSSNEIANFIKQPVTVTTDSAKSIRMIIFIQLIGENNWNNYREEIFIASLIINSWKLINSIKIIPRSDSLLFSQSFISKKKRKKKKSCKHVQIESNTGGGWR